MLILGDVIFGLILGLFNGLLIWLGDPSKKQHKLKNTCREEFLN